MFFLEEENIREKIADRRAAGLKRCISAVCQTVRTLRLPSRGDRILLRAPLEVELHSK